MLYILYLYDIFQWLLHTFCIYNCLYRCHLVYCLQVYINVTLTMWLTSSSLPASYVSCREGLLINYGAGAVHRWHFVSHMWDWKLFYVDDFTWILFWKTFGGTDGIAITVEFFCVNFVASSSSRLRHLNCCHCHSICVCIDTLLMLSFCLINWSMICILGERSDKRSIWPSHTLYWSKWSTVFWFDDYKR